MWHWKRTKKEGGEKIQHKANNNPNVLYMHWSKVFSFNL